MTDFLLFNLNLGKWLFIKNLHLVIEWLPYLENEIKSIKEEEGNHSCSDNFRLFMTTQPHDKFPTTLLELSYKVVNDCNLCKVLDIK